MKKVFMFALQVPQHFFTIVLPADASSVPAAGRKNREEVPEELCDEGSLTYVPV